MALLRLCFSAPKAYKLIGVQNIDGGSKRLPHPIGSGPLAPVAPGEEVFKTLARFTVRAGQRLAFDLSQSGSSR